ncbi:MAG: enolase C-terminal domain-like protein, partial [Candidatus Sericytochromatia bacterium]
GVTVAADEAVRTVEDALALLALGVRVLILKPSAQGGLEAAHDIAQAAAARGVTIVLTSSLDRGVATAGVLHLAAALPAIAPAGLATAGLFAEGPALQGLLPAAGHLAVPTGPGLGLPPADAWLLEW